MKSVILIDDEALARKRLKEMLSGYSDFNVVAEAGRLNEARKLVEEFSPDVVLLDIQLYGENGFDLLDDLPEKTKVIFVTAYNEYAVRAFEVNALDYLMKPVTPERLEKALSQLCGSDVETDSGPAAKSHPAAGKTDMVFLQQGRKRWFEPVESIVVICEDGDSTVLLLKGAKRVVMKRSLGEWGQYLPPELFIRIHDSTIIQLNDVIQAKPRDDGSLSIHMRDIPGVFIADSQMAGDLLELIANK